jgi:four helix bundle protein
MTDSRNLSGSRGQTKNELLEHRMLIFAADTIRTLKKHPTIPISVVDQLTRSAASVGANYAEACNASSKLDFRNKIFISKKETAESRYWIDLCIELTGDKEGWSDCRNESHELLLILQTVINSLTGRSAK